MQSVRIYEMPACKMVSSGIGMFGEGISLYLTNGIFTKTQFVSKRFPILGRRRLFSHKRSEKSL